MVNKQLTKESREIAKARQKELEEFIKQCVNGINDSKQLEELNSIIVKLRQAGKQASK